MIPGIYLIAKLVSSWRGEWGMLGVCHRQLTITICGMEKISGKFEDV